MSRTLIPCLVILLAACAPARADVLDVETTVLFPIVEPGGVGEFACSVFNSTDAPLRTFIEAHVRVPGTGRVRVLGPAILEIPPTSGFEIAPLFLIPEKAEPGPAEVTCRAHAAGPIAASAGHPTERGATRDESTSPFEVQ